MKKNQITTLCKIIISALLSGGMFYYAANCDLPWTILLSVLGTITAIITIVFFSISYDQVPLGQPGSGRSYHLLTSRKEILSPEEFENKESEMISVEMTNYLTLNHYSNMTEEDKFFTLVPAQNFYVPKIKKLQQ